MMTYSQMVRLLLKEQSCIGDRELLDIAVRIDNVGLTLVRKLRQVSAVAREEADLRERDPFSAVGAVTGETSSVREAARLAAMLEAYRDSLDRLLRVASAFDAFCRIVVAEKERAAREQLHDVAIERALKGDLVTAGAKTEPEP